MRRTSVLDGAIGVMAVSSAGAEPAAGPDRVALAGQFVEIAWPQVQKGDAAAAAGAAVTKAKAALIGAYAQALGADDLASIQAFYRSGQGKAASGARMSFLATTTAKPARDTTNSTPQYQPIPDEAAFLATPAGRAMTAAWDQPAIKYAGTDLPQSAVDATEIGGPLIDKLIFEGDLDRAEQLMDHGWAGDPVALGRTLETSEEIATRTGRSADPERAAALRRLKNRLRAKGVRFPIGALIVLRKDSRGYYVQP